MKNMRKEFIVVTVGPLGSMSENAIGTVVKKTSMDRNMIFLGGWFLTKPQTPNPKKQQNKQRDIQQLGRDADDKVRALVSVK